MSISLTAMAEVADSLTLEKIIEELETTDELRMRLRNIILKTESNKDQKNQLLKYAGIWKDVSDDEIEKLRKSIEKERV